MTLAAGEHLGPYELLQPVGTGGMGEVWKARDTRLDRLVALKIAKDGFTERFETEARAVAALNHPHICQIFDVGPNYLVMEFVEGSPLRGPLPLNVAVEYATQILDALDAAHSKGITHRDLKPSNIFVTSQGIKLLDFGLAKRYSGPMRLADSTITMGHTAQGQIVGTLHYMPPEQLQGKDVDPRSDLYSLACVLYEVLSGQLPFSGDSSAKVIAAILEHDPPPSDIPIAIDRILRRAMAKDPEQRFQTARDMKAALTWALEQGTVVSATARLTRYVWIAAVLAFALGAAAVALLRPTSPAGPVASQLFRTDLTAPNGGRFDVGPASGGVSLSPDGTNVAFIATSADKSGLWVRSLSTGEARLLPGTDGAYSPFWSPDSKSIGYFAPGNLYRVALDGSAPMALCTVNAARGGTWTTDGRIIYASLTSSLWVVPETGGTPKRFTKLDHDVAHYWPKLLPGGKFLYLGQGGGQDGSGVYAASLANPNDRVRLISTDTSATYAAGADGRGYLLWLRGTALVAQPFDTVNLKLSGDPVTIADPVGKSSITGRLNLTASSTGLLIFDSLNSSNQLAWLGTDGKVVEKIGSTSEYVTFRAAPDTRTIAAAIGNPQKADLWFLDSGRDVYTRFTFSERPHADTVWSPDGRSLVFRMAAGGVSRKDASGTGDEEPVFAGGPPRGQYGTVPTDWSRDGQWLLYHAASPDTGRDIWSLRVTPEGRQAASAEPKLFLGTKFNEGEAQFSPELSPRWVAYQSDESGRPEVYVRSFPQGTGKYQISTEGGRFPKWGGSSRELYYLSPDDKVMAVDLKPGKDSLEASAPHELFALPTPTINFIPYDVSADGKRFLVLMPPDKATPLTMIVNWTAALK